MHRLAIGLFLVLATGCLSPKSVVCGDGRICPANTLCDVEHHRCVSLVTPAEETACQGLAAGATCVLLDAPGICSTAGICQPLRCGDGVVNGNEECDGTALDQKTCVDLGFYSQGTGLACTDKCKFDTRGCAGSCGDGVINGELGREQCDGTDMGGADCRTMGYYQATGLRCSASCTLDTSGCSGKCGDHDINGAEECDGVPPAGKSCLDYGFDSGVLGCTDRCQADVELCDYFGWKKLASGTDANLSGVWGSAPDDVYAVGGSGGHAIALHWDGAAWKPVEIGVSPALDAYGAVWGTGPKDVYIAGTGAGGIMGRIVHWDGASWQTVLRDTKGALEQLKGMWGDAPDDIFAVGDYGGVWRWDGKAWARPYTGTTISFRAVWGTGKDDVYAVGGSTFSMGSADFPTPHSIIHHWDGARWSTVRMSMNEMFNGVWGSGPNDVFAVGDNGVIVHWDGKAWSSMPSPTTANLITVWGSGANDVLAVGDRGTAIRWDGTSWKLAASASGTVRAVWGRPGQVLAVGDVGGAWRWNQTAWSEPWTTNWQLDVVAPAADDAYVAARELSNMSDPGGIFHWDGAKWTPEWLKGTTDRISAQYLWSVDRDNVYAFGYSGVLKRTPLGWTELPRTGMAPVWPMKDPGPDGVDPNDPDALMEPRGICATGPDDLFVFGQDAFGPENGSDTWHWNGSTWSRGHEAPSTSDVWCGGPGVVVRVGVAQIAPSGPIPDPGNGPLPPPIPQAITAGKAFSWDGSAWTAMPLDWTPSSVWGSGAKDVYVAGMSGSVTHWDGASWRSSKTGVSTPLDAVGGSGAGDVFVAGQDLLLHRRGGRWFPIRLPTKTSFTALAATPRRVFFVGSNTEVHLERPSVSCKGPETACADGWDNDCDGRADAEDPDCVGKVAERCADLIDDDGDGDVDCADADCMAGFPGCKGGGSSPAGAAGTGGQAGMGGAGKGGAAGTGGAAGIAGAAGMGGPGTGGGGIVAPSGAAGGAAVCGQPVASVSGEACHGFDAGGPCVTEALAYMDAPVPQGGTPVPGTYLLTSRTFYVSAGGPGVPDGKAQLRAALAFQGGDQGIAVQLARQMGAVLERQQLKGTIAKTTLSLFPNCGFDASAGPVEWGFTATPFTLLIFEPPTPNGVYVNLYTKGL